ncbi:E3 SUMO-protein ligase PIAS4-A-like isoform X3 [Dermacentor albipictus]|uniref:E3 SUMO-protein ligase PIAS4-A-like isoform X3 n=1 Tax=Dermacentor albipictus TaxID=60249 RepID=UPI0038FC5002
MEWLRNWLGVVQATVMTGPNDLIRPSAIPGWSQLFLIFGSGAMLPRQPFYRPLRQLPLALRLLTHFPGMRFLGTKYSAQSQSEPSSALVLICFAPNKGTSSLGDSKAIVLINGQFHYGVPLAMVNISPLLSRTVENTFSVGNKLIPLTVAVRVVVAARVAEDEMLCSLDENAPYAIRREDTAALVKACFADADETIVDNLQLSLVCPLAKRKIRVPCRGARCRHVQCFDAYAYLALNEGTLYPSWSCPVCNDQVHLEDMRVDLFTLDVLREVDEQCAAMTLQPDGSWVPVTDCGDHSFITIEDSLVEETKGTLRDISLIDLTLDSD